MRNPTGITIAIFGAAILFAALLVGFLSSPAQAESWWVAEKYTADAGQIQFCYPTPGAKFAMRGTTAAYCAYGYKLGDAGTASRSDAGAPLIATLKDAYVNLANGTMIEDAFVNSGQPYARTGDQCIACITTDGGSILAIEFYQKSP